MEEFVVYILFSEKFDKTYVGLTSNLRSSAKVGGYPKRLDSESISKSGD